MGILQSDVLVKVCADTCSETDIAEAQALLTGSSSHLRGCKSVKGDMQSNTSFDILKWFHKADNSDLTYFVCDNMNSLPPVDVHDIDMSLLMKIISLMHYENTRIKDTCEGVVNECTTTIEKKAYYTNWVTMFKLLWAQQLARLLWDSLSF